MGLMHVGLSNLT